MICILVTICARGNSKGVQNKNIRLLNGKPLISYTIQQALEWGKAKHVVVSTDSQEISDIAKHYGAEVPFLRPNYLARDTSPKLPVIRHAVQTCEKLFSERFDAIIDLQPTSPIRKSVDIDNALKIFLKEKPNSVISVVPASHNPYFTMVELRKDGKAFLCKKSDTVITRRQDAPNIYTLNGSIYVYSRDYVMDKKTMFPISKNTIPYIMSSINSVDIDAVSDFEYLQFLLNKKVISLL